MAAYIIERLRRIFFSDMQLHAVARYCICRFNDYFYLICYEVEYLMCVCNAINSRFEEAAQKTNSTHHFRLHPKWLTNWFKSKINAIECTTLWLNVRCKMIKSLSRIFSWSRIFCYYPNPKPKPKPTSLEITQSVGFYKMHFMCDVITQSMRRRRVRRDICTFIKSASICSDVGSSRIQLILSK